jgi:hypothetical protein
MLSDQKMVKIGQSGIKAATVLFSPGEKSPSIGRGCGNKTPPLAERIKGLHRMVLYSRDSSLASSVKPAKYQQQIPQQNFHLKTVEPQRERKCSMLHNSFYDMVSIAQMRGFRNNFSRNSASLQNEKRCCGTTPSMP